jgi:hypothetical protein
MKENKPQPNIVIYTTDDGQAKVQVKIEDETVWLTQAGLAELYQTTKQNISLHIQNIYDEGELPEDATVKEYLTVQTEGERQVSRQVKHYNLDMIISVGYRIKSQIATRFRQWATQRLREYIIKGFTLDDERLKQQGGRSRYFEELLQRVRDIRSSERNFYQKVTDIYATSIDYRKDDELTQKFFATVQNKMHFAVHGHTAAEIIAKRADSKKPMMGLTSFKGDYITSNDITVAKNYLSEEEIRQLNLIVSMYLDFAELQASRGRLMKMADWISKLDEFLKISEHELLKNAGKISAEQAAKKAMQEFDIYREERDKNYISDFDMAVKKYLQKDERANKQKE